MVLSGLIAHREKLHREFLRSNLDEKEGRSNPLKKQQDYLRRRVDSLLCGSIALDSTLALGEEKRR